MTVKELISLLEDLPPEAEKIGGAIIEDENNRTFRIFDAPDVEVEVMRKLLDRPETVKDIRVFLRFKEKGNARTSNNNRG